MSGFRSRSPASGNRPKVQEIVAEEMTCRDDERQHRPADLAERVDAVRPAATPQATARYAGEEAPSGCQPVLTPSFIA